MKKLAAALALSVSGTMPMAASTDVFGEWFAGSGDEGPYIGTYNESKSYFGKWCSLVNGTCTWMIATPDNGCTTGDRYPALLSSQAGSAAVNVVCRGPVDVSGQKHHRFAVEDPDLLDKIAEQQTGRIGFVMSLQSGEFRVFRFSLNGSTAAMGRLRTMIKTWSPPQQGTKNINI